MLQVKDLNLFYGSHQVLNSLTFSIEKADVFGCIGPSGAGKSSLIRCLAKLLSPTSGKILIENQPLETIKNYYRSIGMVFQHFNLLNAKTVEENIAFPLKIAGLPWKERTDELLNFVKLESKRSAYPASLSGGQKQRVGIARALATRPKILFCDEATSALDPKSTAQILDLLRSIQDTTIVLITHDMQVIKAICNRVAVIENGKIVELGEVQDVFFNPEHPTTKRFIQSSFHDIPQNLLKLTTPNRKLLRLRFRGEAAGKPILSKLIQTFEIEANILLGWIDQLTQGVIGTLVIECKGSPEKLTKALQFLKDSQVHYEVLEYGK